MEENVCKTETEWKKVDTEKVTDRVRERSLVSGGAVIARVFSSLAVQVLSFADVNE